MLPTSEAAAARRNVVLALTRHLNLQWRNFVFFLLFNDPFAYIIRADRAGVVVTEPINFRNKPGPLLEFLWRFNFLPPEERGMDSTVRLATDAKEIDVAKEKLAAHVSKRRQASPVYIVEVPDTATPRKVLAWGCLSNCKSLTGRSTRFAAVWDPEAEKVRFLKDMWRTDAETREGESDILRILNDAKVEYVPTLLAGGDLPGRYHQTMTQTFTSPKQPWVLTKPGVLEKWTHHRLLEEYIPTPLEDFKTPKGFLQALFDAFLAHKGAYALGFLHRDVSDGNIMIDENGRGILIDWELAIRVRDKQGASIENREGQHGRVGTWKFMSYNLLQQKEDRKPHGLPDDQQSFFWVGLYYILLSFNPVIPGNPYVPKFITKLFERSDYDENLRYYTGGEAKLVLLSGGGALSRLSIPDNKPMGAWFTKALDVFKLDNLHRQLTALQVSSPPTELPQPNLEQHDALEWIFRDSLDAGGWSPTREPKKGRSDTNQASGSVAKKHKMSPGEANIPELDGEDTQECYGEDIREKDGALREAEAEAVLPSW
ncbi:hypothetical protein MD484_g9008, partial [Candolleomyces efflorescens]